MTTNETTAYLLIHNNGICVRTCEQGICPVEWRMKSCHRKTDGEKIEMAKQYLKNNNGK